VDKLVSLGADVTVVDDLSSRNDENLLATKPRIKVTKKGFEYLEKNEMRGILCDQNIVFHLTGVGGGRGYIQTQPSDVWSNLPIDYFLEAAADSGDSMENLAFASAACVYPPSMQPKKGSDYQLKENNSSKNFRPICADI
jgi:NAD dependent epimerase/dehydratase family